MTRRFVYTPIELRSLAEAVDQLNNRPGIGPDVFYLETRYVPRALGEAADQIDALNAELAQYKQWHDDDDKALAKLYAQLFIDAARENRLRVTLQEIANSETALSDAGTCWSAWKARLALEANESKQDASK